MTARGLTRRGFSLIEMLCVMVLLVLLGGFVAVMLGQLFAAERSQSEFHERMRAHVAVADEFRADVARAEKAPAEWRDHKAGPQKLILEMPNGEHIVYLWLGGRLERRPFAGGKETARVLPGGGEGVGVEFVRDGPQPGLVRMRLLTLRGGSPVPGQALGIAAALAGDRR
jgi:prepilin-type N-terminal cleavage/methylation domain-containing protein